MPIPSTGPLAVYQTLYHLVVSRLDATQPANFLPATEQAFLYTVVAVPGLADLDVITSFGDDLTFVQVAYWALLGRFPAREEVAACLGPSPRASGSIRPTVLQTLMRSVEFSGRQLHVIHIPPEARLPWQARLMHLLRCGYCHLPQGIQSLVRRIYHRGKDLAAK